MMFEALVLQMNVRIFEFAEWINLGTLWNKHDNQHLSRMMLNRMVVQSFLTEAAMKINEMG